MFYLIPLNIIIVQFEQIIIWGSMVLGKELQNHPHDEEGVVLCTQTCT